MGCARPGGLTLTLAALSVGMKRGRTAPPGDGSDGRWESAAASRLGSVLSSLAPCSTRSCISSGEQLGVLATKAKLARAGQGPSRNRLFGMGTPPPTPLFSPAPFSPPPPPAPYGKMGPSCSVPCSRTTACARCYLSYPGSSLGALSCSSSFLSSVSRLLDAFGHIMPLATSARSSMPLATSLQCDLRRLAADVPRGRHAPDPRDVGRSDTPISPLPPNSIAQRTFRSAGPHAGSGTHLTTTIRCPAAAQPLPIRCPAPQLCRPVAVTITADHGHVEDHHRWPAAAGHHNHHVEDHRGPRLFVVR